MMTISLNGEIRTLASPQSLEEALSHWGYEERETIAVALNGSFVPRATYEETPLRDKDCVDVVTLVQGG